MQPRCPKERVEIEFATANVTTLRPRENSDVDASTGTISKSCERIKGPFLLFPKKPQDKTLVEHDVRSTPQ